jgi:phage-related protein
MTIGFNDGFAQRVPDKAMAKRVQPRVYLATFGDGYEQRVAKEINNMEEEYNVVFRTRPKADIDLIASFLDRSKGTDNFSFTIPDTNQGGERAIVVYCPEYRLSYDYGNFYTLEATFKRTYGIVAKIINVTAGNIQFNTYAPSTAGGSGSLFAVAGSIGITGNQPTVRGHSDMAFPGSTQLSIGVSEVEALTYPVIEVPSLPIVITVLEPETIAEIPFYSAPDSRTVTFTRTTPTLVNGTPTIYLAVGKGSMRITGSTGPILLDSSKPVPAPRALSIIRTAPTMYPQWNGSSRVGSPNALPLSLLSVITAFESGDYFRQNGPFSPAGAGTLTLGDYGYVYFSRNPGYELITIVVPMYFSNANGASYDLKNIYYNLVIDP